MTFDPVQVEVWRHLFASIAEEMGTVLERTGFSPNIKERRDHSCALFDSRGRLLAQAAHIPVHLGAMPLMMDRLLPAVDWRPGDMWLCNDPAHGGTHLPDLTLIAPVFTGDGGRRSTDASAPHRRESAIRPPGRGTLRIASAESRDPQEPLRESPPARGDRGEGARASRGVLGFVACRAHHADIGGIAPGSLPLSTELFHEGLILPPVRLAARGRVQPDILALLCANSRTGQERRGDLAAQIAACRTGTRRLRELAARHGTAVLQQRGKESCRYSETLVRAALSRAPDGEYRAVDWLDDDGQGATDLPIVVTARIRGGEIEFDFTGTAPEAAGSVNAPEAVAWSACAYVVRCLVEEEIPMNAGAFAPVRVTIPEGTLVNPRFPRAVAAGNVETSQRIVDVLLAALAPAFPDRIPAASQGTMNNLLIGGWDPVRGRRFAYYETVCGGAGASPRGPGASAVHSHMTNTRNTPIEALERHFPLRVREYGLRAGSGGEGGHRGGIGVVRSIELLAPARVSLISERRTHAPPGLAGGGPGAPGRCRVRLPDGD